MSKKQKNQNSLQPSNPFKIVLPVLIGLVVVIAVTIVIAIVSTPKKSAKVENPKDTFVTIGDYKVTNQKMYEVLKSQYGINKAVEIIDTELLKDVKVTAEQRTEIINKIKYGENADELTPEEKELKDNIYANNLKLSGYVNEQLVAYEELICKRTIKAQELYNEYMKNSDYTPEEYIKAYQELNPTKDSAYVIYLTFASKAQGEKLLAELGNVLSSSIKSSSTDKYNGWEHKDKVELEAARDKIAAERDALKAEIDALEASKEGKNETEVAEIQTTIDEKTAELKVLNDQIAAKNAEINLDAADIALIFINVYNYVNAYYMEGYNPTTGLIEKEGQEPVKPELLVKGVHYTVNEEKRVVEFNVTELEKLTEQYPHCKFLFDKEAAAKLDEKSNASSGTGKFSSTIMDLTAFSALAADGALKSVYTTEFKAMTSGEYFMAYKFDGTKEQAVPYDFKDKKPAEEELAKLKAHLVKTQFNDDIETQMLLSFRQQHDVKFYDRFLNASYKAAYVYLYEKTLKLADYPKYAENTKTSKKLAFTFVVNQQTVEYDAQKLFEELAKQYAPQSTVKLVNAYSLLSNANYNKIYDPYKDEIYDKDVYSNVVSGFNYYNLLYGNLTTVKEYKYAFENGVFDSYGFTKDYGWSNFVRDYLGEDDNQFLAAALSQSYAQQNYFLEKYDYNKILANMEKLYNEYFSLKAINLLVYVNYDNDATPDEFKSEEGAEQENWTSVQIELAKELVAKLYNDKASVAGEKDDTLKKQLDAVVKAYNEASYSDEVWGKYLRAGLRVKLDTGEYSSDKTTATELLNKEFAVIYKEIEANPDYKIGETTEYTTPYEYNKTINTEYGFYRVAITKAGKRIVTGDNDATDYKTLTMDVYKKHLNGETLSENVVTGLKYYFIASVDELYDSNVQNELIADLRESLTANVSFSTGEIKLNVEYKDVLTWIRNNIKYAKQEAELEKE